MRGPFRLGAIALSALTTIVLFELVLQIAAATMWWRTRPVPETLQPGQQSILCVGDSYTFGMGATSSGHAYPAELERLLRERGKPFRVFNSGWPGRNSRDVLQILDQELARTHPAIVYVLVGTNDFWTRPERLDRRDRENNPTKFQWRWRTGRLATLVASAVQTLMERSSEPEPDEDQYSGAEVRLIERGEHVENLASSGRRQEAVAELLKLRDDVDSSAQPEFLSEVVARAATAIDENEQALALGERYAAKYPENPTFYWVLALQRFQRRDTAEAIRLVDRGLVLAEARQMRKRLRDLHTLRADILYPTDPAAALQDAISSFVISRHESSLRLFVRRDPAKLSGLLDDVLAHHRVDAGVEAAIRGVFGTLQQPTTETEAIYDAHLRQMVQVVTAAGAKVTFLSYPFVSPANLLAQRVAHDTKSGWVALESEFNEQLQRVARQELFVADGHLTDRGYGIVAALVAEDVARRLTGERARPGHAVWRFDLHDAGTEAHETFDRERQTFSISVPHVASRELFGAQLREPRLAISGGVEYELTFRARAAAPRQFSFGLNSHDFHSLGLFEEVSLGVEWQSFSRRFVATSSDAGAEIHFDVGGVAVSLELADVVLRRVADGVEIEPEPI